MQEQNGNGVLSNDTSVFKKGVLLMHNSFTLLARSVPSGQTVSYYYAYNDEGKRLGPWTTGQETKTAARNHCNKLLRAGNLIPLQSKIGTFEDLAQGFWDWENSPYLQDRKKRNILTRHYTDKCGRVVEFTLLPYFGKMKMENITLDVVEVWFDKMIAEKYKHTTINGYFGTLRTMLRWAAKKRIITGDPLIGVERLMNDRKQIKIITQDEFRALFTGDWKTVWENDFLQYTANKLAACTGIRCGEILGLRGEYVFDDHFFLCGQYDEYGYRETKTRIKHHIPLTAELVADLRKLMKVNGEDYIFSLDGGTTPVSGRHLRNGLHKALKNIGISKKEAKERGLHLHAWRHFLNTELQKAGLTVQIVQAVTGHKSERMTEYYTHFDPREFGEVPQVQAALLADVKKTDLPALALVPTPERQEADQKTKAS
jgi:integrase